MKLDDVYEKYPQVKSAIMAASRYRRRNWEFRIQKYSSFKMSISNYVGWGSPDPEFATCRAYDLAIDALIDALGV